MMEKLQESVQVLKILFVLDDVWNEDPNKWKQLGDCLKSSLPGSGLLVTTRNGNVGKAMGCFESNIYRVGLLSDEESWELFCIVAFSRKSSGERASLEEIGRKVVRRCKGLPLAVRTIAGLLQFKVSRLEWLNVLESEFWYLEEVRRDILAPLWLSYYNLPSPLKQCFLYCAIFPKDREMEKNELIELWMTQGYIKGTKFKDMETTGDEYFQNLVMRSLFQDVKVKKNYFGVTETWCKMHDLVHDFAQSLVKKECLSMQLDDEGSITLDDSFGTSLRHLSIHFRRKLKCPNSFYTLRKLHSLHISTPMIVNPKSFGLDLEKIFNEFTSLRSLRLIDCGVEKIPSNINKLIHLRELDLSCNYRILELPDSLWELCNLQTLILSKCSGIKSLKGLGRLTNLRHINNSGADFLLPKEMMRITGLRRLWEVKVDVDNEETFSLKHLKNFNQLGGLLQISWSSRCNGDVEDAKQAQMSDKKHITELHFELCNEGTERTTKQDEDLMEALTAPPNLEILQIAFYTGLQPPSWMTFLTSLKMVHLYCWTCENLPALGDLRCLEDLELQGLDRVKKVGAEFLGSELFPELRTLRFACFIDWEEWNDIDGVEEMPIMPNLISLEVDDCPKLKALPRFILQKTRLKLEIENCDALEESTR